MEQQSSNSKTTRIQVLVDPEQAKLWLAGNEQNRNIRMKDVEYIAKDILDGKWDSDAPNEILIDKDGKLIDGQHRLSAVVLADRPVLMWVIFNQPRTYFTSTTTSAGP